jgi:hypothetical protein
MIELATSRSRDVAEETAASTVSASGHGVEGSWFPGSA